MSAEHTVTVAPISRAIVPARPIARSSDRAVGTRRNERAVPDRDATNSGAADECYNRTRRKHENVRHRLRQLFGAGMTADATNSVFWTDKGVGAV
jgi:hypothetical protein